MVAMTSVRHLLFGSGSSKDSIAPEILGGFPGVRDRSLLTVPQATGMMAMVPGRKTPEPPDEQSPVPQLTRVRMSALGAARCPNLAGREGVIVGAGRYRSTVRVMFDGFKSPTSLHSTYIEAVVEEGSSNPVRAGR